MWGWLLCTLHLSSSACDPATQPAFAIWLTLITSVVGTFALIAAVTPWKWDNAVADILARLVHFLGGNFGQAANKEPPA